MLLTQNTRSFTLTRNFLRNFAGLRVASEDDYVPYSYTAAFAGRRMKGKTFYMILNRTSAVLF